jgi:2-keto-3-deoxygluconate permease
LNNVVTGGLPGIGLGVLTFVVTGVLCVFVDKLLGGTGIAGAAASSTAGNSAAVPQAIAAADPSYAAIAPVATVQVAASVIVTAVLTPLLTAWIYRKVQKESAEKTRTEELREPLLEGTLYEQAKS